MVRKKLVALGLAATLTAGTLVGSPVQAAVPENSGSTGISPEDYVWMSSWVMQDFPKNVVGLSSTALQLPLVFLLIEYLAFWKRRTNEAMQTPRF